LTDFDNFIYHTNWSYKKAFINSISLMVHDPKVGHMSVLMGHGRLGKSNANANNDPLNCA